MGFEDGSFRSTSPQFYDPIKSKNKLGRLTFYEDTWLTWSLRSTYPSTSR